MLWYVKEMSSCRNFYVRPVKILKGRRSNLRNRRLILDLRGKENVMMLWRGVGKKQEIAKTNSPPSISHAQGMVWNGIERKFWYGIWMMP